MLASLKVTSISHWHQRIAMGWKMCKHAGPAALCHMLLINRSVSASKMIMHGSKNLFNDSFSNRQADAQCDFEGDERVPWQDMHPFPAIQKRRQELDSHQIRREWLLCNGRPKGQWTSGESTDSDSDHWGLRISWHCHTRIDALHWVIIFIWVELIRFDDNIVPFLFASQFLSSTKCHWSRWLHRHPAR